MNSARDSESIGERIFENGQVYPDIGGREVGGRLHFFSRNLENVIFFPQRRKLIFRYQKKTSVMQ